MHMSRESLLVILMDGIVVGWLAGQIAESRSFRLIGDLIIGIAGAFMGSLLLPQLGMHLGSGTISAIINATTGAIVLLLIIRFVRGGKDGEQGLQEVGINACSRRRLCISFFEIWPDPTGVRS